MATIRIEIRRSYYDNIEDWATDLKECRDAEDRFYEAFGFYPTFDQREAFMNQKAMDAFWASRPL
jgi:hypothetical protein